MPLGNLFRKKHTSVRAYVNQGIDVADKKWLESNYTFHETPLRLKVIDRNGKSIPLARLKRLVEQHHHDSFPTASFETLLDNSPFTWNDWEIKILRQFV